MEPYIPTREFAQEGHVVHGSERVRLAAMGCVTSDTRQQATSERRPRDRADAKHLDETPCQFAWLEARAMYSTDLQGGEHLALLFTVEQAVLVLHRDEGREVVRDRIVCRFPGSDT